MRRPLGVSGSLLQGPHLTQLTEIGLQPLGPTHFPGSRSPSGTARQRLPPIIGLGMGPRWAGPRGAQRPARCASRLSDSPPSCRASRFTSQSLGDSLPRPPSYRRDIM